MVETAIIGDVLRHIQTSGLLIILDDLADGLAGNYPEAELTARRSDIDIHRNAAGAALSGNQHLSGGVRELLAVHHQTWGERR